MRKKFLLLFVIVLFTIHLSLVVLAKKEKGEVKEPIEKITFIHYKGGRARIAGKTPPSALCYKLMGIKWKNLPINYVINPNGYEEEFVIGAISSAVEEWDKYTSQHLYGGYEINYEADWDDEVGEVDYQNEYVFGEYKDNNVIAVTNIWYNSRTKAIVDYDVLFNTYYTWHDCTQEECNEENKGMDLQNIATHETGHGLGLNDVYNQVCQEVTMYGYSSYGETIKRDLATADILGLQKIYGK